MILTNELTLQVKNFKCTECGYSCYLKTDLERHINNVHDKFRSPCPICGKKYSDLRQHVRIVHEGAKVRQFYITNVKSFFKIFYFRLNVPTAKANTQILVNIFIKFI